MLETTSIYFADKYARIARDREREYQQAKFGIRKALRSEKKLKGEGLDAALYEHPDYLNAKKARDAAKELEAIFEKLYWVVVRKHERTQEQSSQDRRQGG